MAYIPRFTQIYKAAQLWQSRSLLAGGSVLSEEAIWTQSNFQTLIHDFVERPIETKEDFFSKLRSQIGNSGEAAIHLAAELLWLMYLFPTSINPSTKKQNVSQVWSWANAGPPNTTALDETLLEGIGNPGVAYNTHIWSEFGFAVVLFSDWFALSAEAKQERLADGWKFADWVDSVRGDNKRQFRHILLHLTFPNEFERIASGRHKRQIVNAFSSYQATQKTLATDIDKQLFSIRQRLERADPDKEVDFYSPPWSDTWSWTGDPEAGLRAELETILKRYAHARNQPFAQHPLKQSFTRAAKLINAADIVSNIPTLQAKGSPGQGNWAKVPWIAVLDSRDTNTTQSGTYIVYLFRQDMSGVYLTLNQGVTNPLESLGRRRGVEFLKSRAEQVRANASQLSELGFKLDDHIDLKADPGLGADYEASTIAYKFYPADSLPETAELMTDLEAVIDVYQSYVGRETQPSSWIFQANPQRWRLSDALRELGEITWSVRQSRNEIKSGDRVFLWESGADAGVLATATVVSEPSVQKMTEEELRFATSRHEFEQPELRVRIRVDRILPNRITRPEIQAQPDLSSLPVITFPNATNYSLTSEHAQALWKLVERLELHDERHDTLSEVCQKFADDVFAAGISFGTRHQEVVRNFVVSLATKRFLISTGLSGSGKTRLALAFGQWLGRYALIPVRPDWTGADALFGFEDALQPLTDRGRAWIVPPVLEFILDAARRPHEPHLLILDEMNLAHVERYFADVLSGMESGDSCVPNLERQRDGTWRLKDNKEPRLPVPTNVFIVGTVNVDETTYMFSPKVLDRANTIEFRVGTDELNPKLESPRRVKQGPATSARAFLKVATDDDWRRANTTTSSDELFGALRNLHSILSQSGFEFGHRTVFEILRFADLWRMAGDGDWKDTLDIQVLQKVLPKLHGSRRKMEPLLCAVGNYSYNFEVVDDIDSALSFDPTKFPARAAELPRTFEKIRRMIRSVRANQFVSFVE